MRAMETLLVTDPLAATSVALPASAVFDASVAVVSTTSRANAVAGPADARKLPTTIAGASGMKTAPAVSDGALESAPAVATTR